MRHKLGWASDLPRHGPGCRAKMLAMKDKLVKEENGEVGQDIVMALETKCCACNVKWVYNFITHLFKTKL